MVVVFLQKANNKVNEGSGKKVHKLKKVNFIKVTKNFVIIKEKLYIIDRED